jgi:hypothetical protein
MRRKCVHTVAMAGWRPDIQALSLPSIKRWADRIGADFNLISSPKFPGYPASYERLQVHEAGRGYGWNVCLDADMLLHRDLEDPTERMDPRSCGSMGMLDAGRWFEPDEYFARDGRQIGVADCFVVSSEMTHDLWTPLGVPFEEASRRCRDPWMVSEYALSRNLARFGLKFGGAIRDHSMVFHAPPDKSIESFHRQLREWGDA